MKSTWCRTSGQLLPTLTDWTDVPGITKEPKPVWGRVGTQFLEEVMPNLRPDGELSLDWGLCIPGKGDIYKVYDCFVFTFFVAIQITCNFNNKG